MLVRNNYRQYAQLTNDGMVYFDGRIPDAWLASAETPIGYPMANVRQIESGKVRVTRELMGPD